jgi:hypothetical protein
VVACKTAFEDKRVGLYKKEIACGNVVFVLATVVIGAL